MIRSRLSSVIRALGLATLLMLSGCNEATVPDDGMGGEETGGSSASGGRKGTGGTASGGAASGGAASGGEAGALESSGGTSSGGEASGGAASGGEASGGSASGGDGSGGEGNVIPKRPTIAVVSPETGTLFHASEVELVFQVEDAAATAYSIRVGASELVRVEERVEEGSSVEVPITLAPGINKIEIAVFDEEGQSDEFTWVLIFEELIVIRPLVTIESPADGAIFHASAVHLGFRVLEAGALGYSIQVGTGAAQTVAQEIGKNARVDLSLELPEGENLVTVAVFDSLGQADADTITLVVDLVDAPRITIDSPIAGEILYGSEVELAGVIETERSLASASYAVDGGAPLSLPLTPIAGGFAFDFLRSFAVGTHTVTFTVEDDLGGVGQRSVSFAREIDTTAPVLTVAFPRHDHAVKTRRVLVKGQAGDLNGVTTLNLELTLRDQTQTIVVPASGKFSAWLDLEPGSNEYELRATNVAGKTTVITQSVYFGQRLGASGASGGAIKNGQIYTWGRNNLGQAGLDFVSHESRTAYCDRSYPLGDARIPWCKAISTTNIRALCDASKGAGTEAATACHAAVDTKRTEVCAAAGSAAPANCASTTTLTANLINACEAAYGASTPASDECKKELICAPVYDAGAPERASCEATVIATPNVYPAPAPPYSATRVSSFSPAASPAAATGAGVPFEALGVEFVSLAFNQLSSSALDSDGRVWSWGDGANGMLCLGDSPSDADENDRKIPHRVSEFGEPGTRVIALARGYDNLILLRSDGTVWACGDNTLGQIGDGTSGSANHRTLPTQVIDLPTNIIQVMASSQSAYALTSDGLVYAWGRNQYGNLGNGTASSSSTPSPVPALVPSLTDVVVLANGRDHVLAAHANGTVSAWGLNASTQVGPGASPATSPVSVASVTDAVAVYANGNQGFYEDSLGRLFGWGQNGTTANLGIVATANQSAPTDPVFGLTEITDAAIGATHGYAMKGSNVYAWGWSFHGSLGAGPTAIQSWGYRTPVLVKFLE